MFLSFNVCIITENNSIIIFYYYYCELLTFIVCWVPGADLSTLHVLTPFYNVL